MTDEHEKITKSEKALLRTLAEEAWAIELDEALAELFEDFEKWADKGISAFELSDRIHKFHNGISRELYGQYTNLGPAAAVSRAIALGLIESDSLGDLLLGKLESNIELFREINK